MRRPTIFICLAALLALAMLVCMLGCGSSGDTSGPEAWSGEEKQSREEESRVEDSEEAAASGSATVHMCGRSVLGGWFEHWGWDYDPEDPVRMGSYNLVYHEMDVPPGIVDTARDAAREAAGDGDRIMFFKLCFEDFEGGDQDSARDNLEYNQDMIEEIVQAAVDEEGLTLILGNALPRVREYTDEWLVWNHREYNRFLEELAGEYDGRVVVLDLYGTLATSGGWLRPEYADDPYDSHLNDAAYEALDPVLYQALQSIGGGS